MATKKTKSAGKKKNKPAVKPLKPKKTLLKAVKIKTKPVQVNKKTAPKKTVKKSPASKKAVISLSKITASVKPESPEKKVKRFKPNKKTRYSKAELKHFREIILLERKAIFESAKANMDALVDKESGEYKGDNLTYSSHMAEQGTDEMEREKNYLFVQRDEKYLGYLQDALMRIDQGTYGICIDCRDEPKNLCRTCPLIIKERLELVPITQHCIECKNLIRG